MRIKIYLTGSCCHTLLAGRSDSDSGPCWAEDYFMRRWFPAVEVTVPEAKFLDVILYSREQLVKEYEAMPGKGDPTSLPAAPWGIISIKAQDENYETPMQVTPTSTPRFCLRKQVVALRLCFKERVVYATMWIIAAVLEFAQN